MEAEPTTNRATEPSETARGLRAACHGALGAHLAERADVRDLLDGLVVSGDAGTAEAARAYRDRLDAFEASVTFLGQVKAGKTSLVNAMAGRPGLLPADVNPWTSVVTSLHLGRHAPGAAGAARFTFFDAQEWERLTERGGRIGELAGRAGAEDERAKIAAQIEAMRARTRRRLGRRFELLLGTSHEYGRVDAGLIERYVCLGDDFLDEGVAGGGEASGGEASGGEASENAFAGDGGVGNGGTGLGLGYETPDADADAAEDASAQGRFADITKAADLWLPDEDLPLCLCLRDTPGVNDTFMIREQITIGAIRGSRLCVVVLSAHQALSSVDMALIRLVSNVRAREVIVFVNRVDELPEPARQIDEIRESLRATLAGHGDLGEVEILFGSAQWAELALTGGLEGLDDAAAEALVSYAEARLPDAPEGVGALDLIWLLSGVPALYEAIWTRIVRGPAREELRAVARGAMNLATGLAASAAADPLRLAAMGAREIDAPRLAADLDALEAEVLGTFDARAAQALEGVSQRLGRSHRGFLDRATAALIAHLEQADDGAPWTYDPTGLRMLLRSGYQVFARGLRKGAEEIAQDAATRAAGLFAEALETGTGTGPGPLTIQPPALPDAPAPVLLGQTIALDLQLPWWRKWWSRRRGYAGLAPEFHAMIEAETRPILDGLIDGHCRPAASALRDALAAFFAEQRTVLAAITARGIEGGIGAGTGDGDGDGDGYGDGYGDGAAPGPADLAALSHAAARLERLAA